MQWEPEVALPSRWVCAQVLHPNHLLLYFPSYMEDLSCHTAHSPSGGPGDMLGPWCPAPQPSPCWWKRVSQVMAIMTAAAASSSSQSQIRKKRKTSNLLSRC